MTPVAIFFTVFFSIFVAELPDKTALAALVLATRNKPLPVFTGTALALAVQSAVAVVAGRLFALLPAKPVHIVAGVVFIISAAVMLIKKEEHVDAGPEEAAGGPKVPPSFLKTASAAFSVVFIAEWGDLTQIGTAAYAAEYKAPLTIFLAATLALWGAAAVAVIVGNRAAKFLNPAIVQKVAGVLFGVVGIALIVEAVR